MIKLPTAKDSKLAAVWATVTLKCCSTRLTPPKKKHIPMTKRRLDSMLPIKDVCTMIICGGSATKARIDTINSTAFLKDDEPLQVNLLP